jgi:hypothetical protein
MIHKKLPRQGNPIERSDFTQSYRSCSTYRPDPARIELLVKRGSELGYERHPVLPIEVSCKLTSPLQSFGIVVNAHDAFGTVPRHGKGLQAVN